MWLKCFGQGCYHFSHSVGGKVKNKGDAALAMKQAEDALDPLAKICTSWLIVTNILFRGVNQRSSARYHTQLASTQ